MKDFNTLISETNEKSDNLDELNEAEQIQFPDVPEHIKKSVVKLSSILGNKMMIDGGNLWDGIHGIITGITFNSHHGANRLQSADLKKIAGIKNLRWIEFTKRYITIGWEHKG